MSEYASQQFSTNEPNGRRASASKFLASWLVLEPHHPFARKKTLSFPSKKSSLPRWGDPTGPGPCGSSSNDRQQQAMGVPKQAGWLGKIPSFEMDDERGYPHDFGNPQIGWNMKHFSRIMVLFTKLRHQRPIRFLRSSGHVR